MSRRDDQDAENGDAAEDARMTRIMQYCDRTLSPREAAEVAAEIARDPEAARLAAQISAGATAAQSAWAELAAGPVPLDLARKVTQAARAPARGNMHPTTTADWRMAAALLVGLALGALGLMLLQRGSDQGLRLAGLEPQPGAKAEQVWMPALLTALQKEPEHARVAFSTTGGAAGAIAVTRWFDTANGMPNGMHCAEFVTSMPGTTDTGGVACRKRDGGWDLIVQDR
jgi:hypothetical protein